MSIDLTSLSPSDISHLRAALGITDSKLDAQGRSPIKPRQLTDLRLLPTKDDPRPTFFWSAETPRDAVDVTKTYEFPKLMWHKVTGTEITVYDRDEQDAKAPDYNLLAPVTGPVDPMADIQAQFDALPEEDRQLLIDAQKQDRLRALQAQLADLPPSALEKLLETANADKKSQRKKAVA